MNTSKEFYKHFSKFTWDLTPDVIKERGDKIVSDAKSLIDSVLKINHDQISYNSIVERLALHEAEFERERNMICLLQSLSPDNAVVEAASHANRIITEFCATNDLRKDLYDVFNQVRLNEDNLPSECDLYLKKFLLYNKRNGVHLCREKRDQLEHISKEIRNLCQDFNTNIALSEKEIEKFYPVELEGLREDFIKSLKMDGDKYIVPMEPINVEAILKYCKVISTRQKIEESCNSKNICSNTTIIERIINLRHQHAQILGYETHADFVTEILMSKNSKNVFDFLTSLVSKISKPFTKEREILLDLKRKECIEMRILFDGTINTYDLQYYQRILEERDFQIDHNLIKEYFKLECVSEKILDLYQSLLQLRFEKVDGSKTWHPDVTLYSVYDKDYKRLLGYFYLDLFSRKGKYPRTACLPLQSACDTNKGHQLACAVLMANFAKTTEDSTSLLTIGEVSAYFHEFGNLMHKINSKTRYSTFHGSFEERDFMEAPLKALENFVWNEEVLKKISCHYITKETMSDDLITKLCHSRKANISFYYMGQVVLSLFDYKIHTSSKVNSFNVYRELCQDYMSLNPTQGTNFSVSFSHICNGSDAQYYGYLWSEVIACDMFMSKFKKDGIFNKETGLSFRRNIFEPGATKNARDLFKNFMERDHIMEPFLEMCGFAP